MGICFDVNTSQMALLDSGDIDLRIKQKIICNGFDEVIKKRLTPSTSFYAFFKYLPDIKVPCPIRSSAVINSSLARISSSFIDSAQ